MAQFEAHGVGHQNPPEETRKAFDLADFDQITERSSIGDNDLHSETKLIEGLLLKLKIGHGVVLVNSARLEKAVKFAAGLKPEGATQLSFGDAIGAEFLQHQGFQRATFQVAALGGDPAGQIIGDANNEVHGKSVSHLNAVSILRLITDLIRPKIRERGWVDTSGHDRPADDASPPP